MHEIFDRSKDYEPALGQKMTMVHAGQFGIITRDSDETVLMTPGVNICAGVALLAKDNSAAALMHVYCDEVFYKFGKERADIHAAEVWNEVKTALDPKTEFRAVAFGGYKTVENEKPSLFPGKFQQRRLASQWINDAMFKQLQDADFVTDIEDARYENIVCDGWVDLKLGDVFVRHSRGLWINTQYKSTGQVEHLKSHWWPEGRRESWLERASDSILHLPENIKRKYDDWRLERYVTKMMDLDK